MLPAAFQEWHGHFPVLPIRKQIDLMKLDPLFEPDDGLDRRIIHLEAAIGMQLPEDYIQFLKQMNGAALSDEEDEDFSIQLRDNTHTDVSVLYGSGDAIHDAARLEFWLNARPCPKSILAGHDSGGNHFWISLRPDDYGTVHFLDRDGDAHCRIAESWTEFLQL